MAQTPFLEDSERRPVSALGVGHAMRRHPLVAVLPMLLCAALAVVVAMKREPIYTASSQVNLTGPTGAAAGDITGALQAAQALAATYSRLITADGITEPLASRFHTTAGAIASELSATPSPTSSIVQIDAQNSTAARAVELANAATGQFASYIASLQGQGISLPRVLQQYRVAAIVHGRFLAAQQHLQTALKTGSNISQSALGYTSSLVDVTQLTQQTIGTHYQALVASGANAPSAQTLYPAVTASSDRQSHLEIYLLGGAVVGLMVGAALATILTNRRSAASSRA